MYRGAWQATSLGVAESDTTEQLTLALSFILFEPHANKEMWAQKI